MSLDLDPLFLMEYSVKEPLCVGLSGGRDSVALVLALQESGFENLYLCHINHRLRGKDSDLDEKFVRCFAQERGLPLRIAQGDLGLLSEAGMEERAREKRFAFFQEVLQEVQGKAILLGHHAEDQAETILFNLCRSGGGLRGMQRSQIVRGMKIVRPFLSRRRAEIDQFLSEVGQPFREDKSNMSRAMSRNRMRHEVLPLLSDVLRRDVVSSINRATRISQEESKDLDSFLEGLDLLDPQGRLFLPKLKKLPASFQRRAIMNFLKQARVKGLSADLLERCMGLLQEEEGSKVNLRGGRFLRRKEKRLFLSS